MLICEHCGYIFEKEDAKTIHENMGECFGFPAYDDHIVCPSCGSDELSNARECEICGEVFAWDADDINCHWCENCKNKVAKKFDDFKNTLEEEEFDCLVAIMEEYDLL